MIMYPKQDEKERATIEWVLGLTGGELEDKPLRFLGERSWHDGEGTGEWTRRWARYWYPFAPSYVEEIERRWRGDVMTIVSNDLYGDLPSRIYAKGKRWRKVARYANSGEVECPNGQGEAIGAEGCTFCDEKITHG
jgi:hypothetical protein